MSGTLAYFLLLGLSAGAAMGILFGLRAAKLL